MSLAVTCAWTLARTILLCLLAWPLMSRIERFLRSTSEAHRSAFFGLLLVPFLFPELLVGYALRTTTLVHPQASELICGLFLFVRMVPVGVVCLLGSPISRISLAAIHAQWLLLRSNPRSCARWWQLAKCYWEGPIRRSIPALALMGLIGFQEFELAALLQTMSWTDWFIAAQRTGLDHRTMTVQALWPILIQLVPLAGVVIWLSNRNDASIVENELGVDCRSDRLLSIVYLGMALLLGCLVPLFVVVQKLPSGMALLIRQPVQLQGLLREVAIASAVCVISALIAQVVVGVWFRGKRGGIGKTMQAAMYFIPGLTGSLLVSLLSVTVFQQTWLRAVYDTPIPWVMGLTVWLLPRAVLLQIWLRMMSHREGVHLAEMLSQPTSGRPTSRQSGLLFRLRDEPPILSFGLLCYWGYLDLPTAYLLGPMGMQPGLVRLYNFMHFGRSAALSAESLVFFGLPIVVFFTGLRLRRLWIGSR